ncbi:MAG: hypothetical protein R3E79_44270 [Caldilineaceae bacterium]
MARNLHPETPEPRSLLLMSAGRIGRQHFEAARVEAFCYLADRGAFAGGVPTLKDNNDRQLLGIEQPLQLQQPRHLERNNLLVRLF